MRSRRIDEQMAVLVESLRELRGDVRAMRACVEKLAHPVVAVEKTSQDYWEGSDVARTGRR
jgi:hypothetical protein